MAQVTKAQIAAALNLMAGVALSIKACGKQGIPTGHLYAALCGVIDLAEFERMIDAMVQAGVICRGQHHHVYWVADKKE